MDKENLIKRISKDSGIKKKDCYDIFDKVIELITKNLKKGKNVSIENFGDFIIQREEMKIFIKKNKTRIIVPPKDVIVFESDKLLAEKLIAK